MENLDIVVPIVTPCTRAGALDLAGLEAVCQDLLGKGCTAIFIAGSTGRGPWFNRADRARMCRALADRVGEHAPLLAGCMASGLPDMIENACAMADSGAQVAVVTAPGYFNYNGSETETILARFADASPIPVTIYDIPGFARTKLQKDVLLRLARHGNIIGIKDSSADFERFQQLLAGLRDRPGFCLLQGKERLLAESLLLGAGGFVVSMVHIDPRPFVALSQACRAGQTELARRIQVSICELLDVVEACFERRPETSTFFHLLNCILRRRGLCDNILLEHEGEGPLWLAGEAERALEICEAASSLGM